MSKIVTWISDDVVADNERVSDEDFEKFIAPNLEHIGLSERPVEVAYDTLRADVDCVVYFDPEAVNEFVVRGSHEAPCAEQDNVVISLSYDRSMPVVTAYFVISDEDLDAWLAVQDARMPREGVTADDEDDSDSDDGPETIYEAIDPCDQPIGIQGVYQWDNIDDAEVLTAIVYRRSMMAAKRTYVAK